MSRLVVLEKGPLVALVGRPNVGKSTLFNRLCGGHHAIVDDQPGVTRDRRYGTSEYHGVAFRVVDTGGLDFDKKNAAVAKQMVKQTLHAVEEADVLVFVLDAQEGIIPADKEVMEILRRTQKPVLVAINKVDGPKYETALGEFFALGLSQVYGISASHGRGIGDFLTALVEELKALAVTTPDEPEYPETRAENLEKPNQYPTDGPIRIALVGRPNAGKSSLINQLVGEQRMIVDDQPGTTRDPVDTLIEHEDQRYLLIDTAGIRRRARVYEPMEKVAVAMAEKAVNRADVVLLVIDAHAGISEQDAKIAGMAQDAGKALVIVFNKRDLIEARQLERLQEDRKRMLQFVPWALEATCSAQTKKGVFSLLGTAKRVYQSYTKRVSTGELNRFFEGIVERHPPPLYQGHPIRLYYITQARVAPPTFVLSVNHPAGMHFSYDRYLQNQLRQTFGFVGTPVRIVARARSSKQ